MKSLYFLFFLIPLNNIYSQEILPKDSIGYLINHGIQLDSQDSLWLWDGHMSEIYSAFEQDTSDLAKMGMQIFIKLESNNLTKLHNDEIDAQSELLTKIIHGAMVQFHHEEQMVIPATAWFRIIKREVEGMLMEKKSEEKPD